MKQAKPNPKEATANKGIEALRLDRAMTEILDAWRAAKAANPGEWK
jgi:hypothetical protein